MSHRALTSALEHALREAQVPGLVSAYLFGSHTTGLAHRESDIDAGVLLDYRVFPTARDRFEARLRLFALLSSSLRTDNIDVVILNDAPPHLARRVVTRGIRAFCGAPELDHAFVRDVQLRAADLEPFLRRTRKIKLEAILR